MTIDSTAHSRPSNSLQHYTHNLDDKYPTRPGFEPIIFDFRGTNGSNEPTGPTPRIGYWASVEDGGPTWTQHRVNISYLLGFTTATPSLPGSAPGRTWVVTDPGLRTRTPTDPQHLDVIQTTPTVKLTDFQSSMHFCFCQLYWCFVTIWSCQMHQ